MKNLGRVVLISLIAPLTGSASSSSPVASPTPSAAEVEGATSEGAATGLRGFLNSFFSGTNDKLESEDEDGMPAALESEASSLPRPNELLAENLLREELLKKALSWRAPDYTGQEGYLGWNPNVFTVPKGLEGRVQFWKNIYTKYTSDQGVLHDRYHYGIVYETVDFGSIMADKSKTAVQKARAREKLVEERRRLLSERLKRLAQAKSPIGLEIEDIRLWHLFEKIEGPHKFERAADTKRIRFQLGQKDRFFVGIYHSGRYLKEMERIFREERLPVELTRLPFVESSFNIHARSKVGASGIWQFMRRTARPYLKLTNDVDERNDPLKATRASARLLRQNYQMLREWPLAVTAYNHGASGVRRIVEKMGTRDIVDIVSRYSSRTFGFASENFYACFLAALEVEREAAMYFGQPKWAPESDDIEIRLRRPMSFATLVSFFDGNRTDAELANPHLLVRVRRGRSPIAAGHFIRVPKTRRHLAEALQKGRLTLSQLAADLKKEPLVPEEEIPGVPAQPLIPEATPGLSSGPSSDPS